MTYVQPPSGYEDYATLLEDFIPSIDNVPSELHHILQELLEKDTEFQGLRETIHSNDIALRKLIRAGPPRPPNIPKTSNSSDVQPTSSTQPAQENTSSQDAVGDASTGPASDPKEPEHTPADQQLERLKKLQDSALQAVDGFPEQVKAYQKVEDEFVKCKGVVAEKIQLADRMRDLVERHLKRLIHEIEKVQDALNPSQTTQPSSFTPFANIEFSAHRSASEAPSVGDLPAPTFATPTPVHPQPGHKKRLTRPPHSSDRRNHQRRKLSAGSGNPLGFLGAGSGPNRSQTPEVDEQLYCFCQQVSYGEMIACDNDDCPHEWFHLSCVGLTEPPTGVWYCSDCQKAMKKRLRE